MKKKPQWIKRAARCAKTVWDKASASTERIGDQAKELAEQVDEKYDIAERARTLAEGAHEELKNLDDRFEVGAKAKTGMEALGTTATELRDSAAISALSETAERAGRALNEGIVKPVADLADETGLTQRVDRIRDATIEQYGKARAWIKPYYAPETPDELLRQTKRELIYINACILQISRDEAEHLANKLGTAFASKIAGAASVGTLLGLIGTFGTASTGTAIATLHGAAATNATFYWVGSLLGGGMATGGVLTGGVGLAVGFTFYQLIGSEARRVEDLSEPEFHVVEATGFLIAAINDVLDDPAKSLGLDEAELLLENTLRPLHQSLMDQSDDICKNLDGKNRIRFRQHAIVDFKNSVIDGFEFFIHEEAQSRRRYPQFAIAGVLYALLTRSAVDDSRESQLALDAIRRMRSEWKDASESDLSNGLSQYEPEQVRGLANNAKGIYHEMLFVDDYNELHDETYAELFGATNHPGADVQIRSRDTSEVLEVLQLKATSDERLIVEHFEKYPDIRLLATEEIATKSGLGESSGISNQGATEQMDDAINDLADNTAFDRIEESAGLAVLVAAGREAINVLNGKQSVSQAGIEAAKAATIAATSTALVAYLFS